MSKIVPKLNLNKTPQLVENNSLVMAKNIRLLEDGSIGPDTSLEEIETVTGDIIHDAIYHPATLDYIDHPTFSILNVDTAIKVSKGESINERDINNLAFDFSDPNNSSSINHYDYSDRPSYIKVNVEETVTISARGGGNIINPVGTSTRVYTYDPELNLLVGNNKVLGLYVLKSYYENYGNPIQPAHIYPTSAGLWGFIHIPREYINNNITFTGNTSSPVTYVEANYYVINPVYFINDLEEVVVQQAWTEDAYDTLVYIDQIVGLNNKIYFFKESNYIKDSTQARTLITAIYPNEVFDGVTPGEGQEVTFAVNEDRYITRNGLLFGNSTIARDLVPNLNDRVKIFEFDEVDKTFRIVPCAWTYNGGKINGCVSVNGTGELILTICEYDTPTNVLVPIKHININRCTELDDESIYTQTPNIPISNIKLSGRYIKNIPAGVYQFFIRYKIHDEYYTNWFPCSKELFTASHKATDTLQGTIRHIDIHEDSNNSFIFIVEHLFPQYCSNFEQYQLGFILSSEGGIFARSWKHFDINNNNTDLIYFEYNKDDIEEINIDDLLKTSYNVFNVKNITQYKNRLYVANYIETDFNENLQNYANSVIVKFKLKDVDTTDGYYLDNKELHFNEDTSLYDRVDNTQIKDIFYNSHYCVNTIGDTASFNSIERLVEYIDVTEFGEKVAFYHNSANVPNYVNIKRVYIVVSNTEYNLYVAPMATPPVQGDSFNNIIHTREAEGFILDNTDSNNIIDRIIDIVKDTIIGITDTGAFKCLINDTVLTISNFNIEYYVRESFNFQAVTQHTGGDGSDQTVTVGFNVYRTITYYRFSVDVVLKQYLITDVFVYNQYNTLLPFTKYEFYIHYIKQNGTITNGYSIGTYEINRYCKGYTEIDPDDPNIPNRPDAMTVLYPSDDLTNLCFYREDHDEYAYDDYIVENQRTYYHLDEISEDDKYIIYPRFEHMECPPGYVGCFISVSKYGNNVAEGFNYEFDDESNTHKIDCLELDSLLYNIQNNIIIKTSRGNIVTSSAKYFSSSSTNPTKHLGCSGHVEFSTEDDDEIDVKCWIILDSLNKPYNKTLIKVTPYINLTTENGTLGEIYKNYENYSDVNTPGYFCEVQKLNREYCDADYDTGYYVSGNDVYTKGIMNTDELTIEISENTFLPYNPSPTRYIYSNFNLSYVSLTSDLNPIIRKYGIQREDSNNEESDIVSITGKQIVTLVNSLLASYILELKSHFRDYTRKLFYAYDKNKITKFDNTIRVSNVDVDELYRYIYKFEATDYYNVPTHRGIITNLVAVANTLYVHCEHSLFKFTDNKTLNAQEENVTLQENDIFNSGISEVFDAQYGYAGLSDRRQSLVTYNAYVFYDSIAQIIYAFGGEQQVGNVSDPIKKLIDTINPTDVRFVGDEIHNRFFVNLINNSGNVCLSFNFANKNFISIHDIDFKFGFHSRRHTYFVHDNINPSDDNNDIIGWSIYRITDKIHTTEDNFIAYQNCYKQALIKIDDCDRSFVATALNIANACVDIIINVEYEKIKVLEYISWICSQIDNYGNNNNFVAEENLNREFPGSKIRIYTDSTNTALIDLLDSNGLAKIAHNSRNRDQNGRLNANPDSWQDIQYNCGVWSMNYFRDVRNNTDVFSYKDSRNKITGGEGSSKIVDLTSKPARLNLTQENSLIYGKYIVVRFIFNNRNFKLENVIVKLNDYEKTK